MNQLSLSDDLIEITAEINIWKQQAGQAVFEIGKRLKHVKENDLVHGQWIDWLKSIEIDHSTAQKFIRSFDQFGKLATSPGLPVGKIFEMLSLPENIDRQDFIHQPHVIPSTGETKTVDEMKVKELREVTKALKQATAESERLSKESAHYQKLWNQEKNKPAQIVTRSVEVAPSDYNELKTKALRLEKLQNELDTYKRKAQLNEREAKEYAELKKNVEFLHREKDDLHRQIESATALSGLTVEIDNLLKTKLAPIKYSRVWERMDSEVAVRNFIDILGNVRSWLEDMERYVPKNNRKIVEVIDYDPAG